MLKYYANLTRLPIHTDRVLTKSDRGSELFIYIYIYMSYKTRWSGSNLTRVEIWWAQTQAWGICT